MNIRKAEYKDIPKLSIRFTIIPFVIQAVSIFIRLTYSCISDNSFSLNSGLFPFVGLFFEIAAVTLMIRSKLMNTALLFLAVLYLMLMIAYTLIFII